MERQKEELRWAIYGFVVSITGRRSDNLNAERSDGSRKKGYRFFEDDEDEYGLEDILQALCFLEVDYTTLSSPPSAIHLRAQRNS